MSTTGTRVHPVFRVDTLFHTTSALSKTAYIHLFHVDLVLFSMN